MITRNLDEQREQAHMKTAAYRKCMMLLMYVEMKCYEVRIYVYNQQ